MRIGIAFDLAPDARPDVGPDDRFEEFDKPSTIDALAAVLHDDGHDVVRLGDGREFLTSILAEPLDLVWNLAEGEGIGRCRESRVPAALEMLGIPYTGSDPLTLAAALDKDVAKRLVRTAGVAVPRGIALGPRESRASTSEKVAALAADLEFPWILKPAFEGSSKGVRSRCLVDSTGEAFDVYQSLAVDYEQPILVEEFIDGDEVTVGLIGNPDEFALMEAMRIVPTRDQGRFVYSIELKRDWSETVRYESPAKLAPELRERLFASANDAFVALGCRDVARIDYRIRNGTPYFIEANPLPGLAPDWSDLVILGKGAGLTYPDLVRMILRAAIRRVGSRESVLGECRV